MTLSQTRVHANGDDRTWISTIRVAGDKAVAANVAAATAEPGAGFGPPTICASITPSFDKLRSSQTKLRT
jgi:hypothetical protein